MAPSQLVDQFGRPIELARLTIEESGASLTGIRRPWSGHPSRGLTPQRLSGILLEAEEGLPERYFELAEDMEEKDLHYLGVISTRKRAVAQLEITVEAASDETDDVAIADALREWLRRDTLQDELFDILDAVGKGVSCCEIIWETSAKQWSPKCVEWRDPRWFAFDHLDGRTLRLREGAQLLPLTPFKYIVHAGKSKSGLPIRGGLARAVSWVWLFKNFSLKDWVAFGEVFGQPYRVGKYHASATEEEKDALLRAVASIGSDAAAIIPESMVIEFVEAAKTGSIDVYDRISRFLDEQISKGVLGQTTTTEVTQGGGSRALGQVHDEVRQDIKQADSRQLAATLNRDLVRPFVDLNYGPQARYPRLVIGLPDELGLREKLDYTQKFVAQGLRVEASQVRDRLGWTEPAADAEILKAAPVAAPVTDPATDDLSTARARRAAARVGAHAAGDPAPNLLDRATADAVDGWQRVMTPIVDPLPAFLGGATSLEDARNRLADLVGDMDVADFTSMLADAEFVARVAGRLGIPATEPTT